MNAQIWTKKSGTTTCKACKSPMTVQLNHVYLFRDGSPIHDHHGSPSEQERLKAERDGRRASPPRLTPEKAARILSTDHFTYGAKVETTTTKKKEKRS